MPDLNLPIADMLPRSTYSPTLFAWKFMAVSPDAAPRMIWRIWRTKPHALSAGCRRKGASFSRRKAQARLQAARHYEARRRPEAVAATFLPGRLRKSRAKSLQREGDRVVYIGNRDAKPFDRISDFLELLDE
jgi:transcription-repair coupling factor (superfamily II helicase)